MGYVCVFFFSTGDVRSIELPLYLSTPSARNPVTARVSEGVGAEKPPHPQPFAHPLLPLPHAPVPAVRLPQSRKRPEYSENIPRADFFVTAARKIPEKWEQHSPNISRTPRAA